MHVCKSILVACCLLAVAAGQVFGEEGATRRCVTVFDGSPETVVLLTSEDEFTMPFESLGSYRFTASSGYMHLLLSPVEHALFKDGKLVRYMFVNDGTRKQRAAMEPALSGLFGVGYGEASLSVSLFEPEVLHRSAWGHGNTKNYRIAAIDGKPCSVVYDDVARQYRIEASR